MQGTQANRVRLVVAHLTISLPLLIWGAMGALQSNSNSPIDWVDLTFQPRSDYQAFCDQFGPGDTLVVSWPGCSINDPKIDALAHLLRTSPTFHPQNSPAYIGRIVTGRELYQFVLSAHGEAYAREKLKDIAFGDDGETTSLIIQFTSAGLAKRAEVVPLVEKAVQKVCGQPTNALKLA